MELQDELLEKKVKKDTKGKKKILGKDSIQFNSQDLDQEQKVDMNPVQLNTQNIHIFVSNDKNNYSSKITGITYMERSKNIAANAKICLFFGNECRLPIYETNSDINGNFVIEDIPPGYYTLLAELGDLEYRSHYIKVLPCQNIHESILLKKFI